MVSKQLKDVVISPIDVQGLKQSAVSRDSSAADFDDVLESSSVYLRKASNSFARCDY